MIRDSIDQPRNVFCQDRLKNIGYITAVFFLYISYFTWLKFVMENKIGMLKTASKHI